MIQVSRFRLYPSKGVENKLFSSFDKCCFVYNHCLENQVFKDNILPQLKQEHPELYEVHSIVLQNVVHQLQSNLHVLHALKEKLDDMLEREGRADLAQECFKFLPTCSDLDLKGWTVETLFSHK